MIVVKYIVCLCVLCYSQTIVAQSFAPVDQSSSVKFLISNLGFDVSGMFKGLKGIIVFDEKNISASSFQISINSTSIDTDNDARDNHLKGLDYFNVQQYPVIKLVSTKIAKSTTPGYYVLFATLTIKNKMQDISFSFTVNPEANAYRFKAEFKIKRRDFDIGRKNTISNELKVKLDVLTKKN